MASKSDPLILFVERTSWSFWSTSANQPLAEFPLEENSCAVEPAELRELFDRESLWGCAIVVALESNLCLASNCRVASPKQARDRRTLTYLLEESLPVAAEEILADFVTGGTHVLGFCCDRQQVKRVIDPLCELGADLRAVSPLAILAGGELQIESGKNDLIESVWLTKKAADVTRWENGKPVSWRTHPANRDELTIINTLDWLAGSQEAPRRWLEQESQSILASSADSDQVTITVGDPRLAYALKAAARITAGTETPAVDFLRDFKTATTGIHDPLARDRVVLACAAACLLAASAFWLLMSGSAIEAAIENSEIEQTDLFRDTFPDKRVPNGILRRLQSEARRLTGTRAGGADAPEHPDASLLLQEVLTQLPDTRYQLKEIRIEGGGAYLIGEVRSHSEADRIAASLRKAGLAASPPSTRQDSGKGVEFRVSAEPRSKDQE